MAVAAAGLVVVVVVVSVVVVVCISRSQHVAVGRSMHQHAAACRHAVRQCMPMTTGFQWISMDFNGLSMAIHRFLWISIDLNGLSINIGMNISFWSQ